MLTIDALQYSRWSRDLFLQMRAGGLDCVHVTIAYHETALETLRRIGQWNRWFEDHGDLIVRVQCADDVLVAQQGGRTGIVYGFQNCSPIEDDYSLVEVFHQLGVRFMQLSYNNQSLLATGCYETTDPGITRFGKQVIREMNRVGMVIDMSHSAERSTLDAIEWSTRPIAITHANPTSFHPARRNKSDVVLRALGESAGMLGFSLYPHHLPNGSRCTLAEFCDMIGRTAELIGVDRIGIGSDLCQNQPDDVVTWMRNGRWSRAMDFGEGSADHAGFPAQPEWFTNSTHYHHLATGLSHTGFDAAEVAKIMGGNWFRFFQQSFGPESAETD